ncbi:MAG: DUF4115 domain-containing protein [Alphaproteobacteria bacterium]|nr:DUF4115 domain-containing protein [Alphaproteobacteria bacterium]
MTEKIEIVTAGEMLRRARTTGRRKRELPTIAKQLCIKEEFLEALEAGEYEKIPELVYILGFARNYAMELELDPDMIAQKIKEELGIVREEDEVLAPAKSELPDRKKIVSEAADRTGAFLRKNWKWLSAIIVSALVIAGAIWGVSALATRRGAASVAPTEAVVNAPAFNLAVKEEFGTENRAAANVVLQATQESWVKIEDAQGETMFSRVLVPGEVYYVGVGNVKGTFGNAGGIDVWVNGALAPKLGANHTRKAGVALNAEALLKTE